MNLKIVVHSILILVCQPSAFAAAASKPIAPLNYLEIKTRIQLSKPELAIIMNQSFDRTRACGQGTVLANPVFWHLSEKEQERALLKFERRALHQSLVRPYKNKMD
jgi:hypothetical protein